VLPGTVLVGPTYRHRAASLIPLPPAPTVDHWPRCRPAPPVSRAAPRRPCPAILPCSCRPPPPPLSPVSIPLRGTPKLTPILLSRSPPRIRQFGEAAGASLHSVPRPRSSSSPYPPPTRLPHWLPPEILPPLRFPSERHRFHRFMVRPPICHCCPHLRPPSPPFFHDDTAGSCLHRSRPPELPPCRRTPPPKASYATSLSHRRSGELHPRLNISKLPKFIETCMNI
jgi:hypothetical protein